MLYATIEYYQFNFSLLLWFFIGVKWDIAALILIFLISEVKLRQAL